MASREQTARHIIDVCHRLYARGLAAATDGNVSARLEEGTYLVTPSGRAKGRLEESDLVEIRPDGTPLEPGRRPTSELAMHLFIYRERPEAAAIVHSHPPYATGFAVARKSLDERILPEVIVGLGTVPLAPYATPSTGEVARSIAPFVKTARAILLANHGVVTIGRSLEEAFLVMEKVEHAAHVLTVAKILGGARSLTRRDLERLRAAGTNTATAASSRASGQKSGRRRPRPRRQR